MANGDISYMKVLGSFPIGGGGFTSLGGSANNKVMTWGQISGIWEDTDGLNLTRYGGFGALGLSSCDFIRFDVVSVNAVFNIEQDMWTAAIGRDDENIYVVKDGATNPAASNVCIINFLACGDSNAVANLT